MKILVTGQYEFWNFRRGEILFFGLEENNIETITCIGMKNYTLRLIKHLLKRNFDAILVNGILPFFLTYLFKPLHKKKIIYDVFISRYNTEVEDRKRVKKNSLKAKLLFLSDKLSCKLSDVKFIDTKAHVKYFKKTFGLEKDKFEVIYVGANDKLWKKKKIDIIKNKKFNVVFWGAFSPLHGTKTIVKAAKLLENEKNIMFHMLGFAAKGKYGQKYSNTQKLAKKYKLKNIKFYTTISLKTNLVDFVNSGDVCLGIFGNTKKAKMVIPHKAFETLALQKPLITMDSIAAREIFNNNKNSILIQPENEKDLANAILKLKNDTKFKNKIAKQGYELYKNKFTNKLLGKDLIKVIK